MSNYFMGARAQNEATNYRKSSHEKEQDEERSTPTLSDGADHIQKCTNLQSETECFGLIRKVELTLLTSIQTSQTSSTK